MTHRATLTLPLEQVQIHIGLVPVSLYCAPIELAVEYEFTPGLPEMDCFPDEPNVFKPVAARLTRAISLNDGPDTMSLILSAGTDFLPYLGDRQVDWIAEHLPVPGAPA